MTTIIYHFPPSQVHKLAEAQGITYEDALQELVNGTLTLPERLPLSPEEEQQSFEDELIEAMQRPITSGYTGQYI